MSRPATEGPTIHVILGHRSVQDNPASTLKLRFWLASVDQCVGSLAGALEMHRQHTSVELLGPFGLGHHAGLLHVTEDGHIAQRRPGQRCHPVQRVAALEDLQVARFEMQGADQ